MRIPTPYKAHFTISQGGKAVPYGGVERPDGVNSGFRSLKGKTEDVSLIPEAAGDPALANILKKINVSQTALFSVGCESQELVDSYGHRVSGYMEFAINHRELAKEPTAYFDIFYHFVEKLAASSFSEKVQFEWELLGAKFFDSHCSGFTCIVTLNTFGFETTAAARMCWANSLDVLRDFLATIPEPPSDRIY